MTNASKLRDEIERGPHWALETGEPESDREYATRIALQALEEAARICLICAEDWHARVAEGSEAADGYEQEALIEAHDAIRAFAATLTPGQVSSSASAGNVLSSSHVDQPASGTNPGSPNAQERRKEQRRVRDYDWRPGPDGRRLLPDRRYRRKAAQSPSQDNDKEGK